MSGVLKDLQPSKVFEYFEAISQIPRESGHEKAISDYMVKFAKELGLEVHQDKAYNIYIKKPSTKGYENVPGVILQGHLDMVCEKNKDTEHDFKTQGLDLYIEGDWIGARGTTLGADNGVAIAYQMAILADRTLKHPTIECLMTTDEERGMTGVAHLEPEHIQGKILVNLDTEVEGEFLVSCAGGAKVYLSLPYERVSISQETQFYKLTLNGLKGGHSGAEIHYERGNAHLLMGRVLDALRSEMSFDLVSFEGGTKDNVITRECEVVLAFSKDQEATFQTICEEFQIIFQSEYSVQDPDINLTSEKVNQQDLAICEAAKNKLIDLLLVLPNGVMGYDKHIKGLVQTSLNLGIVKVEANKIRLGLAVRSSVASRKEELLNRLKAVARTFDVAFDVQGDYPAWPYQEHSRIRDIATSLYEAMYDKKPTVTAIHAGLECGFIAEKCPGLDMISIGPNLKHVHSPQEIASISSMARVYEYLVKLLENLIAY